MIKAVKEFLDSEDVFYENTDETIAKYHENLPLKKLELSKLITDNYYVVPSPRLNVHGKDYIYILCQQKESFIVSIGTEYGKHFKFTWAWARKHAHYDSDYLYDNFVTKLFRTKKLERILK